MYMIKYIKKTLGPDSYPWEKEWKQMKVQKRETK